MELKRVERKGMPNHDVGDRQRPGQRACQSKQATVLTAAGAALGNAGKRSRLSRHDDGTRSWAWTAKYTCTVTAQMPVERNRPESA